MKGRAQVRDKVEDIPLRPLRSKNTGIAAEIKITKNEKGLWTVGGLTHSEEDGELVQHKPSREPVDSANGNSPFAVAIYLTELLYRMDKEQPNE